MFGVPVLLGFAPRIKSWKLLCGSMDLIAVRYGAWPSGASSPRVLFLQRRGGRVASSAPDLRWAGALVTTAATAFRGFDQTGQVGQGDRSGISLRLIQYDHHGNGLARRNKSETHDMAATTTFVLESRLIKR